MPRPSLALCPPGAVLVRIRYASVCGSDMPLWKADPMPTPTPGMPSAQVAFDGFCGHEVVGEIMESKSEQFAVGSPLAPPHPPLSWQLQCGGGLVRPWGCRSWLGVVVGARGRAQRG